MAVLGRHSLRKYATIWLASLCLIVATAAYPQDLGEELPESTQQPVQELDEDPLPTRTIPSTDDAEAYPTAPVLIVDQERLFSESAWGKRVAMELEKEGDKIDADNERLVKQLSDEEAELTKLRETLDPAEFRKRAEAFDIRATEIRRERATVAQKLSEKGQEERSTFIRAAVPIMGEVMQRRQAIVVLDRRTVFVLHEAIDITSELIAEIDARLGDGPDAVQKKPEEQEPEADDNTPAMNKSE